MFDWRKESCSVEKERSSINYNVTRRSSIKLHVCRTYFAAPAYSYSNRNSDSKGNSYTCANTYAYPNANSDSNPYTNPCYNTHTNSTHTNFGTSLVADLRPKHL